MLIIVESPEKAKLFNSIFKNLDVLVLATKGHISSISSKKGNVRISSNGSLAIDWSVTKRFEEIIEQTRDLKVRELVIATDNDRAGGFIGVDFYLRFKDYFPNVTVSRMRFNSMSKEDIMLAFQTKSSNLEWDWYAAEYTRQALDYCYGWNLSEILWKKLPGCKSFGRVRIPTIGLIREREKRTILEGLHRGFKWYFKVNEDVCKCIETPFGPSEVIEVSYSSSIVCSIHTPPKLLNTVDIYKINRSPRALYSELNYLYNAGLITYPRTDSRSINRRFLSSLAGSLRLGKHILCLSNEEHHECVRPTSSTRMRAEKFQHLYDYIFDHTMAACSTSSLGVQRRFKVTFRTSDGCSHHRYIYCQERPIILGWREWYDTPIWVSRKDTDIDLERIEIFQSKRNHLFTPGGLFKQMECLNIGRPSTYLPILQGLVSNGYVGYYQGHIITKDKGFVIWQSMKHLKFLQVIFTSWMERFLDKVTYEKRERAIQFMLKKIERIKDIFLKENLYHNLSRYSPPIGYRKGQAFLITKDIWLNYRVEWYGFKEQGHIFPYGKGTVIQQYHNGQLAYVYLKETFFQVLRNQNLVDRVFNFISKQPLEKRYNNLSGAFVDSSL